MKRKKMLLADGDIPYLNQVSGYFMERVPQIELLTFTKEETLMKYLIQESNIDIVVIDEDFVNENLERATEGLTRIVLSSGNTFPEKFFSIKKYQRLETLANEILLRYAEENNTIEIVRGHSRTKIVAMYSPAGGTGKTTLALALATASSSLGFRVLYLNLEEIDCIHCFFEKTSGTLSDVFLALKTKGSDAGIKLKSSVEKCSAGFFYLTGVDSVSEYDEISEDDLKYLLRSIREISDYDLVVIDLSSSFSARIQRVLEETDQILVPIVANENCLAKMEHMLAESRLHDYYDSLFQKMSLVMNQTGIYGSGIEGLPDEIKSRIPCSASIVSSQLLGQKQMIFTAGERLLQIMNPLVQAIMGENNG